MRHVEGTLPAFGQRGAGGGNYYSGSHDLFLEAVADQLKVLPSAAIN
jgi:hypothetical protein